MDGTAYKELLEALDCCVLRLNAAGYISYCSPQVRKLLGYTPDKLVDRNICELISGDDEPDDPRSDLRLLLSLRKPVRHLQTVLEDSRGEGVPVELTLNPATGPSGTLSYAGTLQAAAKPVDTDYEHISWTQAIENILEAVLIISQDLKITYANQNFYDLFSYEPDDIIDKPLSILGGEEQSGAPAPMDIVDEINRHGHWQGEVKRRAKPGNYIPVLLNARPYSDTNGRHKGYIGTYLDLRPLNSVEQKAKRSLMNVIQAVMAAMELRMTGRKGYVQRMSDLCVAIGLELGMDSKELDGLRLAALLHDLGLIEVPQEIVSKRSRLNEFERAFMQNHPRLGYDIIKDLNLPWPVARMVLQHHERMDGSGYPAGLQGEHIMLEARILAVVDTLESVSLDPASHGLGELDNPLKVIEQGKGRLFDPRVVDACLKLLHSGEYPEFLQAGRSSFQSPSYDSGF